MSDLKLLSPHQPTSLERLLMDAVSKESPSDEQRQRVRQALGLPAVAAVPPTARLSRSAVWIKAGVAATIVASALWFQFRPRSTPSATPAVSNAAPLAAPAGDPNRVAQRPASPEPVAEPLPALEAAEPSSSSPTDPPASARGLLERAPSVRRAAAPNVASSLPNSGGDAGMDLSEQLRLIEAARAAVAARNTSSASQALASYSARFPRGAFSQEASVLRIETLDLQGNHAQASMLAKSFLARHPNSPHVSLVQRIAGQAR